MFANWNLFEEGILSSLKIHQYFNFVLLSSKFGVEKPDTKIFEKALELGGMKEGRSKQVLHIGDDEVRLVFSVLFIVSIHFALLI